MVAHFVGGPLHGKDRQIDGNRNSVLVYTLDQPTPRWLRPTFDEDEFPEPTVNYSEGEYRAAKRPKWAGASVPRIFVWME